MRMTWISRGSPEAASTNAVSVVRRMRMARRYSIRLAGSIATPRRNFGTAKVVSWRVIVRKNARRRIGPIIGCGAKGKESWIDRRRGELAIAPNPLMKGLSYFSPQRPFFTLPLCHVTFDCHNSYMH